MNILVIGGNGFVGPHLLSQLLKTRNTLFATYQHSLNSEARQLSPRVRWLNCDITRTRSLQRVLRKANPSCVYHLAAQASVAHSWKNPEETFEVNAIGTLRLIHLLSKRKTPCQVLVVESGEVYGAAALTHGKISEFSSLSPQNPYAASKACQDLLLLPYLKLPHLKIIRVRPFNHLGPGQGTLYVASNFAHQIAMMEAGKLPPILRVGNLKSKRDFTDVRDMVRAYILLAKKGERGEVVNVASGNPISIAALLRHLLALAKIPIRVRTEAKRLRPNDTPLIYCVPTQLIRTLGWRPRISLERSLSDTLNYWRKKVQSS